MSFAKRPGDEPIEGTRSDVCKLAAYWEVASSTRFGLQGPVAPGCARAGVEDPLRLLTEAMLGSGMLGSGCDTRTFGSAVAAWGMLLLPPP